MIKIPRKNYILVIVICLTTLIITSYLTYLYKKNEKTIVEPSVLSGYVLELGEKEIMNNLENYVLDNPDTVLYVSYGEGKYLNNFENELKDLVKSYNIKSELVFLNLNLVSNRNFLNDLKEKFFSADLNNNYIKLEKQPNLFLFKGGKIVKVLYYAENKINIDDVKKFLINEEVIKND